ncbi:Myb-like DNA-binding domain protein [Ancylostoma duodenale]|uniref:Myb-like DNA-binding domain protein n=1 Tax=Ancylostoma duodenale TaxID=51022 RepID=A0A0C2DM05_9BILA|nr:Myb-like DNA-binding domain protein [Ancylostoma duodenale]
MARVLNRTAQDVTTMAGKLKHMKQTFVEWTQTEQKQLEAALQQFPKGCEERWDKIAAAVPTKTKEQCQQRLKELVELVRRKKAGKT